MKFNSPGPKQVVSSMSKYNINRNFTRRYIVWAVRTLVVLSIFSIVYLGFFTNNTYRSPKDRSKHLGDKLPQVVDSDPYYPQENVDMPEDNSDEDLSDLEADAAYDMTLEQIPVLVIACNRPSITRCLDSLLKNRPSDRFPIVVSQDCEHEETTEAILKYSPQVTLIRQPDRSDPEVAKGHSDYINYYKIARHYKWALNQMFNVLYFKQVIIVEDDMEVSPDFFQYFEAFLPLLKKDKSLFCVSSWNDNGKTGNVEDPYSFYRTDFFPGLGWMLRKDFWNEIEPIWPATYWDDWLRHPDRRKGRQCIRPEISRTFNFGKQGVSGGLFYDDHIGKIKKNELAVSFTGFDKDTLKFFNPKKYPVLNVVEDKIQREQPKLIDVRKFLPANYDKEFIEQIWDLSTEISASALLNLVESSDPYSFEAYWNNKNLLPNDRTSSRIMKALQLENTCITYEDVLSKHYCGINCRRRFRISFNRGPGPGKFALTAQTAILKSFHLMDDIREDIARTAYMDVVTFKLQLKHKEELYPYRCTKPAGDQADPSEYIIVHVAPRTRP